jgi:hypothetical protein
MHQPFMARWIVTTVATTEDAVILARARGFIEAQFLRDGRAGRCDTIKDDHVDAWGHECWASDHHPIIVGELVPEGGYFVMVMLSNDAPGLDDVRARMLSVFRQYFETDPRVDTEEEDMEVWTSPTCLRQSALAAACELVAVDHVTVGRTPEATNVETTT